MTPEIIRKKLSDRVLSEVAKRTGISYQTIVSLANGKNTNPTYRVVQALQAYFREY